MDELNYGGQFAKGKTLQQLLSDWETDRILSLKSAQKHILEDRADLAYQLRAESFGLWRCIQDIKQYLQDNQSNP